MVGVRLFMFISNDLYSFLIIVMVIECSCLFIISHECHINEIKVMKIHTFHHVIISSSISHMPH